MPPRSEPNHRWPLRPPPEHLQRRYLDAGFWLDTTLGAFVDERLQANAALELRIWSKSPPLPGHDRRGARARRCGSRAGSQAAGIGPGDVVAFQLPNWMEAAATFYGASLLGAVLVPIVHFYGAKEVRFILAHTAAKALVTAASFRQSDYLAALATFRAELPALATVVVVGGHAAREGPIAFDELARRTPIAAPLRVDPREPAVIGFTSGTTSDPKGVIHSHHTIVAETRQLADMQSDRTLPLLVGAPVGHAIGMLSGLLVPLCQEQGDPPDRRLGSRRRILDAMVDADLTCGSGATYFLTSLLDHPGFTPQHLERMKRIGLGGAPVPAAISDRAESMGISIVRSYGSTEHPSTTGAKHDEPAAKRKYTDGHALVGRRAAPARRGRQGRSRRPGRARS